MYKISILILLFSILAVTLSEPGNRIDKKRDRTRQPGHPPARNSNRPNERNRNERNRNDRERGRAGNQQSNRRNSRHQPVTNERNSSDKSNKSRFRTPAEYLAKPLQFANKAMAYMGEKALVPLEKTYNATGGLINKLKPTIQEARNPLNAQQVLGGNSGQGTGEGASSNAQPLINVNVGSFKQDASSNVQKMNIFDPPSFIDWNSNNDKSQSSLASAVQSTISAAAQTTSAGVQAAIGTGQ